MDLGKGTPEAWPICALGSRLFLHYLFYGSWAVHVPATRSLWPQMDVPVVPRAGKDVTLCVTPHCSSEEIVTGT